MGKITSLSYERYDKKGKRFMFFDIVQSEKINDNSWNSSFYKIKLNEELLEKYQEIIKISNNVYIIGYLNTYLKDNKNIYYIFPKEIKLLDENYNIENKDTPIIDYASDGTMIWNGKRCESAPMNAEETKEMEDLLNEYR